MRTLASLFGGSHNPAWFIASSTDPNWTDFYNLLWSMYYSDVYDELAAASLLDENMPDIHPIRNPTYRLIEFYAAHIWPGPLPDGLPIVTNDERVKELIYRVWRWSNWASKKQLFARRYSLLGEEYIKVASSREKGRVYHQLISTEHVTDTRTDERDNLSYIRLDVPLPKPPGTRNHQREWHVEIWEKEENRYRRWVVRKPYVDVAQLGEPEMDVPITSFGFDFIPIVQAKFKDLGDSRGVGALSPVIWKVLEADLIASTLHQRLFRYNKPDWLLFSAGRDSSGRNTPPIIEGLTDSKEVKVAQENMWSAPAGWDIKSLIANIDYNSALAILNAHLREIETDLPELEYYRMREFSQVTGRAVRMLMSGGTSRVTEARGNAESALIKADEMSLTIGKNMGLPDFANIGTYEEGAFDHDFEEREVIPLNDDEIAQASHTQALADSIKIKDLGYSTRAVLRSRGLSDEDIDRMNDQREIEDRVTAASQRRDFNQGLFD